MITALEIGLFAYIETPRRTSAFWRGELRLLPGVHFFKLMIRSLQTSISELEKSHFLEALDLYYRVLACALMLIGISSLTAGLTGAVFTTVSNISVVKATSTIHHAPYTSMADPTSNAPAT